MTRGNSNPRRRRIRTAIRKAAMKLGKWGGAVVTVLLLVLWIGSGWWYAGVSYYRDRTELMAFVDQGGIWLGWATLNQKRDSRLIRYELVHWSRFRIQSSAFGPIVRTGWALHSSWLWRRDRAAFGESLDVLFPLWVPLVVVFAGTSLVWYLDSRAMRRARVGLCAACGYDLAGTAADMPCPECGKARST